MLNLIAEDGGNHYVSGNEPIQSKISIQEIVSNLSDILNKTRQIGENELHYLTSIAMESAKEKLLLEIYERH